MSVFTEEERTSQQEKIMSIHSASTQQGYKTITTSGLWRTGFTAAVVAAAANALVFFISQRLLNLTLMLPAGPGSTELAPLTVAPVLLSSAVPALAATALLWMLERFAARPFPVFTFIAIAFLVISFVPVFALPVDGIQKAVLNAMHVVAGVIIVGMLAGWKRAPSKPA